MSQFVSIARIVRTHGVRGEVSAILLTDYPGRFRHLQKVYLSSEEKGSWEELQQYRFHKGRIILKFRGRDRPEEVRDLLGCDLQISEIDRVELPDDTYFDSDLVGCQVFEGEQLLGEVVDLLKSSADSVNLVIATSDRQEIMVPLVKEFVLEIDIEEGRILVELPPGVRELSVERRDTPEAPGRKDRNGP